MCRYSQSSAECLSGICVAINIVKSCLLFRDRNDVVTHKYVVLVTVGERHESLQKRNEVAECLSRIAHRCRHSQN